MAWWAGTIAACVLLLALHFVLSFLFAAAIRRFAAAFIAAGCVLLIVLALSDTTVTEAWAALAWFVFFSGLYVFGFTLSRGSISVKMLQLLRPGPLERSDIAAVYSPEHMVKRRFERLLASRLVVRHGDEFALSERGRRLLNVLTAIQRCCHGRPGY